MGTFSNFDDFSPDQLMELAAACWKRGVEYTRREYDPQVQKDKYVQSVRIKYATREFAKLANEQGKEVVCIPAAYLDLTDPKISYVKDQLAQYEPKEGAKPAKRAKVGAKRMFPFAGHWVDEYAQRPARPHRPPQVDLDFNVYDDAFLHNQNRRPPQQAAEVPAQMGVQDLNNAIPPPPGPVAGIAQAQRVKLEREINMLTAQLAALENQAHKFKLAGDLIAEHMYLEGARGTRQRLANANLALRAYVNAGPDNLEDPF